LLKRPEVKYSFIRSNAPAPAGLSQEAESLVEISVKYEGYIQRQIEAAEKLKNSIQKKIPADSTTGQRRGLSERNRRKIN